MKALNPQHLQIVAWGLTAVVVALAVIVWGQGYEWHLGDVGIYQLFPLLGLMGFSIMWAHYVVAAMRQYAGVESSHLRLYFEVTSAAVLVVILLHPGLLGWQLWHDGLKLPPGSFKLYVGASAYWYIWFGITALALFLAYELRHWYGKKSWWRFVQYGSDVAMFLVFFHALRLGRHVQGGWFRGVWYVYGITLVFALVYMYTKKPASEIAKEK